MIRGICRDVRRLLGYLHHARWQLAGGILCGAFASLSAVWMTADLLGNGVAAYEAGSVGDLIRAILLALPWLACTLVLQAIGVRLAGIATAAGTVAMRGQLLDVMLRTPLAAGQSTHSGAGLSLYTNDTGAAMNALIATLSRPVNAVVVGIGGFVYVMAKHWSLAVLALAAGLLIFLYSVWFAGRLHRLALRIQELMAVLETRLKDLLDGMVIARTYGMLERLSGRMEQAARQQAQTGIHWAALSGLLGAANNAASNLIEQILVFAAGFLLLGGVIALPDLLRVSTMAGGVAGVFHVSRLLVDVQKSLAGAQRVYRYVDEAEAEQGGAEIPPAKGEAALEFYRVEIGYGAGTPVLLDFSLTVRKGEFVALIGPSGCGKSTVLRMLQGLYLPDRGEVRVWGTPTTNWQLAALRRTTALVPQEPVLYPGTIAQNIALGMDGVSREHIERAAITACADSFIRQLPDGYDTPVTERGQSLSGGQRQRIALARALLSDAPILLLDEATSAMDPVTEEQVHLMLRGLKGEKTIVFVSHKRSTLAYADRVIRIGAG